MIFYFHAILIHMIGIFDSGAGGLTVASAIRAQSPNADFVYFGDLAHAPFGSKSKGELLAIAESAIQFLRAQGATEFVAACNSISVMQSDLQKFSRTRLIEMVEPAARSLHLQKKKKILVIATEATVRSGMYEQIFFQQGLAVEMMACPELATAIEEGRDVDILNRIIEPVIDTTIQQHVEVLVFGCTHYPLIRHIFADAFSTRHFPIEFVDPSESVALEVASRFDVHGTGLQTFFVSKSSSVFDATVKSLFGSSSETNVFKGDGLT